MDDPSATSLARDVADLIVESIVSSTAARPRFAVLELPVWEHPDRPQGPLYGAVATESFLARAAALDAPERALHLALHWRPADVTLFSLPPEPQIRERLAQRLGQGQRDHRDHRAVTGFAKELLVELNTRDWGALVGDPDFVVVGRVDDDPAISRAALGDRRWDAFRSTLRTRAHPDLGDVRAMSRAEVSEVARRLGLPEALGKMAADDAAWAVMLEPGGTGRSRLGGRALLPRASPWPRNEERPLTHLASIALREVPSDVEGRSLLPADGSLAFFADLSEEGEFFEPLGPEGDPLDGRVALVYSSDENAVEVSSPNDVSLALGERRTRLVPRLQIRPPDWQGDPVDRELLIGLAGTINGGWEGVHQMLGHPAVVQEDPRGPNDVALFHLSHDPGIGFEYLDGGDVLICGPPDALRDRRWDCLTWWPSSC